MQLYGDGVLSGFDRGDLLKGVGGGEQYQTTMEAASNRGRLFYTACNKGWMVDIVLFLDEPCFSD